VPSQCQQRAFLVKLTAYAQLPFGAEITAEQIERSAESQTLSDKDSASGARRVPRSLLKQRCNLAMALLAGIRYRGFVVPNSKLGVGAALQKQFR
jgi:hypothetical protein